MTPRGARRAVAAAVVAGLVLRLAVAATPKFSVGDEIWYLAVARDLVRGGAPLDDPGTYGRSPGVWLWAAAVLGTFGADAVAPIRFANALVSAATPWLAARVARRAFPRLRATLPAAAAWVQALNPVDVRGVQWVLSETIATPLLLGVVLGALAIGVRPTLRRALGAGLAAGVLVLVRVDLWPTLLAALAVVVVRPALRRRPAGRTLRAAAVAGAAALAVCAPWSLLATSRVGRPVFVADIEAYPGWTDRKGWSAWISTSTFARREWLRVLYWPPHVVDPAWIPDAAFADDAERREVLALIARARAAGANTAEVDGAFLAIAERKRAADPFRFHVVLPALRTADVWFDPLDDDTPAHMIPTHRSAASWALEIALRAARPLAGAGFVLCLGLAFALRRPAAVVASVAATRTFAILWLAAWTKHMALHEVRYVAVVQPLALLVLAAAAVALVRRTGGRR